MVIFDGLHSVTHISKRGSVCRQCNIDLVCKIANFVKGIEKQSQWVAMCCKATDVRGDSGQHMVTAEKSACFLIEKA